MFQQRKPANLHESMDCTFVKPQVMSSWLFQTQIPFSKNRWKCRRGFPWNCSADLSENSRRKFGIERSWFRSSNTTTGNDSNFSVKGARFKASTDWLVSRTWNMNHKKRDRTRSRQINPKNRKKRIARAKGSRLCFEKPVTINFLENNLSFLSLLMKTQYHVWYTPRIVFQFCPGVVHVW